MTFAEVEIICKGYETRMARIKEVPRFIAAILLNVNRGSHAPYRLEDVFPLYTDRTERPKLITLEEYNEAIEEFKNVTWQSRN
jgi:hypothetical protein